MGFRPAPPITTPFGSSPVVSASFLVKCGLVVALLSVCPAVTGEDVIQVQCQSPTPVTQQRQLLHIKTQLLSKLHMREPPRNPPANVTIPPEVLAQYHAAVARAKRRQREREAAERESVSAEEDFYGQVVTQLSASVQVVTGALSGLFRSDVNFELWTVHALQCQCENGAYFKPW